MKAKSYYARATAYARAVVAGKIIAGNNKRECERFLADLKRDDLIIKKKDAAEEQARLDAPYRRGL